MNTIRTGLLGTGVPLGHGRPARTNYWHWSSPVSVPAIPYSLSRTVILGPLDLSYTTSPTLISSFMVWLLWGF